MVLQYEYPVHVLIRLGLNLALSNGIVSVCKCVRACVEFVYESMYSHVYSVHLGFLILSIFLEFFKSSNFGSFGPHFLSRIAQIWIFNYVGGLLHLVRPRKDLRLQIESLGTLEGVWQKFWRNSNSNCTKWTCKFRDFENFWEMWGFSQIGVLDV